MSPISITFEEYTTVLLGSKRIKLVPLTLAILYPAGQPSKTQVVQNLFPTEGSLDHLKGHVLV